MSRYTVALIASGINGESAVASRIAAMASGLRERGWHVDTHDVGPTRTPIAQRILDQVPASARTHLERLGIEGDVLPSAAWGACTRLKTVAADVAIVSVPPFSLLAAGALSLPTGIPWVADYRDPWSARTHPPALARVTRKAERMTAAKSSAVTFAGGPRLADLLATRLDISRDKVVSVPNGHDPRDLTSLEAPRPRTERNGAALDLVFGGYWYGRNGPGVLIDALARLDPGVVELTTVGGVAPSIEARIQHFIGKQYQVLPPMARPQLYQRLARADAAIVPLDPSSAVESRIPAKVYDCLAIGTPIIALCPPDAALLTVPGAERVHHVDYRDTEGLADLLAAAANDRSVLRSGPLGAGPTRDAGVDVLDRQLRTVCARPS